MGTTKCIDWEAIEAAYRANTRSLRDIAEQYGTTHTWISKRAKKEGWKRDLQAKIKAATLSLVSKAAVSNDVAMETSLTDQAIIDANAETQKNVILSHRTDIRRLRGIFGELMGEVAEVTGNYGLFEELGDVMHDPEATDKRNEIYRKVIDYPARVEAAKKLTETYKTLVGMEREAFGIEGRGFGELIESNNLEIAFVRAA